MSDETTDSGKRGAIDFDSLISNIACSPELVQEADSLRAVLHVMYPFLRLGEWEKIVERLGETVDEAQEWADRAKAADECAGPDER